MPQKLSRQSGKSICILEIKQNKSAFNRLANLLPMILGKLVITKYYFKPTSNQENNRRNFIKGMILI